MRIIGLGNALVDILIKLDNEDVINKLQFPKGSMQLISSEEIPTVTKLTDHIPSTMVSGGSAANTIHGLASLGISCGYIGKIGQDRLGHFYESDLASLHVESLLYKSATETGRAFTLITPDSERTFATYLGAAIELQYNEIDSSFMKNFDLLHIEGYLVQNKELVENALKIAKKNNLKISLDLASYNVVEANHAFLSKIIPSYIDIVFANEEEAKAYTNKEPEEALRFLASQTETAIVKIGKNGSLIQRGANVTRIIIEPVKSIDTTGAGDQYAAGFLFGYANNLSPEKCGKLGSLLAGSVVQYYGARIPKDLWPGVNKMAKQISKE
jgi:sugar/nucleoside kinase (ribokinase family)